ncbi:MAG: carboxypeptidase regulatory-like domain-containing protein [Lachnospiraceae bacterium]|nr:carboxypeptidase regulatory-like domain-containing protein [Lachnospiraceae bacterium]MBQ9234223.1 carboxypeptidase regulatory-like domain-containing protein [Lachnospiraceae bacterium]
MRKSKRILKRVLSVATAALMTVGMLSIGGTQRSMEAVKAAEPNVDAASQVNFSTILGRAANYGLLADRINQDSHMETTIATKIFKPKGANEIDLCGADPVWLSIASLDLSENSNTYPLDFGSKIYQGASSMTYYLETTADVYAKAKTKAVDPGHVNADIVLIERSQAEIEASVNTMQTEIKAKSDELKAKTGLNIDDIGSGSAGNYTIDLTGKGYEGKTVYINVPDDHAIQTSLNSSEGLKIKKDDSTVIVFNLEGTNISMNKYNVNGITTEQTFGGEESDHNKSVDKSICQKIVWNMPNATSVSLDTTAGLFIIPQTTAVIDQRTSAGWIATGGTINVNGEFHYIYHDRSTAANNQLSFGIRKAFTKKLTSAEAEANEVGTISADEDEYTFEIYESNSSYDVTGTPYATVTNDANSKVSFPVYTFDGAGDYYFVIKEKAGTTKDYIQIADGEIDFKITVSVDASGNYSYKYSSSKYATAADKQAGNSITTHTNEPVSPPELTFGRFYNKVNVGNLEITVRDEDTKELVPGAKVKVTDPSGKIEEYTTDANGKITVENSPIGNHSIVVTEVPANYRVTTGETATVEVEEGKTATHLAEITTTGGLKVTVLEEDTGAPVKDAIVKVTDEKGNSKEYTTDENGVILVNPTDTGNYEVVVTKVPAGKKVTVGEKNTLIVTKGDIVEHLAKINTANTGNLEITVTDEKTNTPVPDATVDITNPLGVTDTHTTDTNGKVSLTGVPVGDYTVEVTKVPEGYSVTTNQKTTVTVTENETSTKEVKINTSTATPEPSKTPTNTTNVKATNTSDKSPQTGDDFNAKAAVVMLIISLIGVLALIYGKKKYDIF